MQLVIKENYERDFIDLLIEKIKRDIMYNISRNKLIPYDIYINKNYSFKKTRLAIEFIKKALNTFRVINLDTDGYIIELDKTQRIDNVKVEEIVKLINYGNINLSSYPFLLDEFKRVDNDIDSYYYSYKNLGVVY